MAPMQDPMLPVEYVVNRIKRETSDTYTLDITPANGEAIAPFQPGQFNMLYAFGNGEVPISISGDPQKSNRLIHTIRAVGAVTSAMKELRCGASIGVRGPFGSAWPVETAIGSDVVLIAGGIGLAPLRPALYSILSRRDQFGKVILLYGARSPEELLFRKELMTWRKRLDIDVLVTVDHAAHDWRGHVGVVTTLMPRISFDPAQTIAMICGPEVMMRFAVMALENRDLDPGMVFISMERNMKCGIGLCGHCQYGPHFICKDGPVFNFKHIEHLFSVREV